jgi:hypothetical protein
MNPQDVLNQQIRMLIGDLQVNLMMANARIQELETQLAVHADAGLPEAPEAPKTNGKHKGAPHAA